MSIAHPSILSKLLGLFGRRDDPEFGENTRHQGDRDGALTLSEEPAAEEVARVAREKSAPRRGDD